MKQLSDSYAPSSRCSASPDLLDLGTLPNDHDLRKLPDMGRQHIFRQETTSRMTNAAKMLGIQIQNGFSPEARVFANLLRHRQDAYEAKVIHQYDSSNPQWAEMFSAVSTTPQFRLDAGWRPGPIRGKRSLPARIASRLRYRMTFPTMLRVARAYDPDVIYSCQQVWDITAATYMAKKLAKPQIVHLHYIIGPWLGKLALARLKTCDHIVTVSDFIRQEVLDYGIAPDKVTTVRNAMSVFPLPTPAQRSKVRAEWHLPEDSLFVGMAARFDAGKGVEDTIAAFCLAAGKHPHAYLLLIGDGQLRPALEAQAQQSGFGERIVFTGRRSDVPDLLAGLDIFCHPSRKDPAPLAVLEACAAGLPVIGYAEGGICEFLIDGETGLLAPTDDVAKLAAKLDCLLTYPEMRKCMGLASRARIEAEFQPKDEGAKFAALINEVCTAHASSRF